MWQNPPDPYQTDKPNFTYADLIGQAILSSKEHQLTFRQICQWISRTNPYYKLSNPIWQGSIRMILSTMDVFHRVQRDQTIESPWTILDKDVPCFEGGGFDHRLYHEMNDISEVRLKKTRAEAIDEPRVGTSGLTSTATGNKSILKFLFSPQPLTLLNRP